MSSTVPFVKAVACGNDFLIIESGNAPFDVKDFSRRICDRHQGVGADGVEWLYPTKRADIEARLFNADGSEAEISGNGTRCVAAYLCAEKVREKVSILTGAGVKVCQLSSHKETEYEFETAMGKPEVGERLTVKLASGAVSGIPVSMGNPHFVIIGNEFSSGWQAQGAELGSQPVFPQGVNVEYVKPMDRGNIAVRFFERGVGETQSSGTGSCAAAVATIAIKKADSPVRVHAIGGMQTVRWEEQIYLRGSAKLVCRGEFFI